MMEACTKASGARTKSMEKVSTYGQMAENTMESGEIIICTAEECIPGRTVECTKVNMRMIVNMDMEFTPGTTVSNTKVGGRMENNTEKESTARMAVTEEVSGKMESVSNGSTMPRVLLVDSWTKKVLYNENFYNR